MSAESNLQTIGDLAAAADLSTHLYRGVRVSGVRVVNKVTASTQRPLGILQNKPIAGEGATVAFGGQSKAILGTGGATAGQELMFDANGALVVAATTGNIVAAIATETGVAAEIISVMVVLGGRILP